MTSPTPTVLIFGPTGAVGSAAAVEAHRRGAHVWLAMRDTSKALKNLSESDLQSERYTRVQADLSQPETLKAAVQQSGATAAFAYTLVGSEDSMRESFAALGVAGINYIVLLSSYTVKGEPGSEENMQSFITATHAKTEVALQDSGIAHTAVRPMYFNSNLSWYTDGFRQGTVPLLYPENKFDYLAPEDIGAVCGAVLGDTGLRTKDNGSLPLVGPRMYTQREAVGIVGRVLGRDIEVKELSEDEWYEQQSKQLPKPVVDALLEGMRDSHEGLDRYPEFEEVSRNVAKYAGRESMTLDAWVDGHRSIFE